MAVIPDSPYPRIADVQGVVRWTQVGRKRFTMRRLVIFASVTTLLVVISSAGIHAARQFCDPGSFLAKKVDSVDALVKQISTNPTVTKRYAKLYRVSPEQVISHFQSSDIKIVALTKPMKATVYYVGERTGRIRGKTKVMPAGTKIFMAANGTPLMDMKCGNPFRRELIKEQPPKPMPQPREEVKAVPPVEVVFVPPALTPPPVGTPPPVQMAFVPPVQQSLAVAPVARPSVPIAKVAAPALIALGGVHTSGGAVPEPGTIIAALTVLVPAGVLFRRRRS